MATLPISCHAVLFLLGQGRSADNQNSWGNTTFAFMRKDTILKRDNDDKRQRQEIEKFIKERSYINTPNHILFQYFIIR